ncbi:MAG: hypothetical protein JXA89_06175 [Anaerolineae bacterium]|nr:hypothetical protein [Anaerolineae bacterium]
MNNHQVLRALVLLGIATCTAVLLTLSTASPETPLYAIAIDPAAGAGLDSRTSTDSADPPSNPVKLVFLHHSTGGNWLADVGEHENAGGLGTALMNNNYYASATNYGWTAGGDTIGDLTDIGHWWTWFRGPNSATYMAALYAESGQNVGGFGSWSRLASDPGGENEIILFKSCFPNSALQGSPGDPVPSIGSNLLRGEDAWSEHHSVANAKGIYIDLLNYFSTRQDKLFVVITAPPLSDPTYAANARAFNRWLVNDWLAGYAYNNVAVFDFYNVLTDPDNHHRFHNNAVEYVTDQGGDTLVYPSDDDHPNAVGGQKAAAEFVPLLNVYYNRWQSGGSTEPSLALTSPTGGETWVAGSQHQIKWQTAGTVSQVNLTYSSDGFGTSTVIATAAANTGSYSWTTPAITTTAMQVRVESVISPTEVCDVSGLFSLVDAIDVYLPTLLNNYTPSTSTNGERIQPADLTYLGAFRLPAAPGTPDDVGWEWGGTALTYYPGGDPGGPNDGYPGSLFGAGHDQTQYLSEVGIPIPVDSPTKDVTDLNTAGTLQSFANVRGTLYSGYWEMPRVGLAYLPKQGSQTTDKLYFSWAMHAPGEDTDTGATHGWCELDLSAPQAAGIWRVGGYPKYVTADYMFDIPSAWANTYTPGKILAAGRFRDGGQGAEGPSLLAIGPWNDGNPPPSNGTLSTTPLLLYDNVLDPSPNAMNDYHHSDEWSGGAWLTTGDKAAVVFVGTKGQGDCWYGCADGTDAPPWPDDCNRGWWSTTFVGQILFYDPGELAAVAQGTMETWEPQPYATLNIDDVLFKSRSSQEWHHVGAMAFDRQRGLLYVAEPLVDEDRPIVHAWRVD